MHKHAAILVAFVTLSVAACTADSDPSGASMEPGAAQNAAAPAPSTPALAPCPTIEAAPAAPAGPKKTPSPVEHCEGVYKCPGHGDLWFAFDGNECKLGGWLIFHADGRTSTEDGLSGRWTGDYTKFRARQIDDAGYKPSLDVGCDRKSEQ